MIIEWIKKYPKKSLIGAFVLLSHLYFIFFDFSPSSSYIRPKSSIVVQTRVLKPKPKVVAKAPSRPKPTPKKAAPVAAAKKKAPAEQKKELPLSTPKQIENLRIDDWDEPVLEKNSSYLSLLVGHLHDFLHLPDDGSVHVKLTVLKNGRVEKVEVLYAESVRNQHYIERELAHLTLPSFTEELEGKLKHTFTLHFCHEN